MKKHSKKNIEQSLELREPWNDDIVGRDYSMDGDVDDMLTAKHLQRDLFDSRWSEEQELRRDEDEWLRSRGTPVDFAGSDLDVPGSELDDDLELLGSEDEENNLYSLGGGNHEDQEDSRA